MDFSGDESDFNQWQDPEEPYDLANLSADYNDHEEDFDNSLQQLDGDDNSASTSTSTSASHQDSPDTADTVSLLINGKLFELVGDGDKGKCTMCAGERATCTTANRGSSMTRHQHDSFVKMRQTERIKPKPTAKKRKVDNNQPTLDSSVVRSQPTVSTKQANFDEAMMDFIVYSLKPYSTVEDPYFRTMVATLDPRIIVMGRGKAMRHIDDRWKDDQLKTKQMLRGAKYVATGADIWSCRKHAYMGITATVLLPTFKRVSRAIACEHFKDPHTGPHVAQIITSVHESNDLVPPKLVGCVTDRGANIVKAFKLGAVDSEFVFHEEELKGFADTLPSNQRYYFHD